MAAFLNVNPYRFVSSLKNMVEYMHKMFRLPSATIRFQGIYNHLSIGQLHMQQK